MKYIVGDICEPVSDGKIIICHIVNDLGVMGAGVAKALYLKWYQVKTEYIRWAKNPPEKRAFKLGNIQPVTVDKDIVVINMIGQNGTISNPTSDAPPVRYEAIKACLAKVAKGVASLSNKYDVSVHIPYLMGCGLAGGDWKKVKAIINDCLCKKGIEVIIYVHETNLDKIDKKLIQSFHN